MHVYTTAQWLLFFFLYCLIGWVWESGYVSLCQRQWVNRGFLHGPFLPLYGSGAMVILISTIPVRENPVLVFLVGMVCCTILELCTGLVMERLFHVRYWDYSNQPLNVKGYISPLVSLVWGCFSLLLVEVIHPPVAEWVQLIPPTVSDILAFVLTAGVAVDFTKSFGEAMDLRAILDKLSESNEQLRRLGKRIEVVTVFAEENRQEREAKKRTRKERFAENLAAARATYMKKLQALSAQAETYFQEKEDAAEARRFRESVNQEREKMHERTDGAYRRASRILRRNPGAVSRSQKEELETIKGLEKK